MPKDENRTLKKTKNKMDKRYFDVVRNSNSNKRQSSRDLIFCYSEKLTEETSVFFQLQFLLAFLNLQNSKQSSFRLKD